MNTVMELLNERFNFEEITKGYNCEPGSDIDSIEWFIENGHRSNSLRNGFGDALEIAKEIKEFSNECTKTAGTGEQIRSF